MMSRFVIAMTLLLIISCNEVHYDDGFYGLSGEIWSERLCMGGDSYEFKVNCSSEDGDCLLVDAMGVTVLFPDGGEPVSLRKEFTEDMRRYAVHGPPGSGFPPSGNYQFTVFLDTDEEFSFFVEYERDYIDCAGNVSVQRCGNDLQFFWAPPSRVPDDAWAVIIVYGDEKADSDVDPNHRSGTIHDAPLTDGQSYAAAVAYYFDAGWSKTTVEFVW